MSVSPQAGTVCSDSCFPNKFLCQNECPNTGAFLSCTWEHCVSLFLSFHFTIIIRTTVGNRVADVEMLVNIHCLLVHSCQTNRLKQEWLHPRYHSLTFMHLPDAYILFIIYSKWFTLHSSSTILSVHTPTVPVKSLDTPTHFKMWKICIIKSHEIVQL